MQIDPIDRSVRLSVGELANFRNAPRRERTGGSLWRAQVGQQWHRSLESDTREQNEAAQFEVPIKAKWIHQDWTFEIQGRVDQLIPGANQSLTIREIKTIRDSVPADELTLLQNYPEYFAQVAIYRALAQVLPEYSGQSIHAELVFVDISSGMLQVVPLEETQTDLFEQQLEAFIPFLNHRRHARIQFKESQIQPAFETLRSGQSELFETLERSSLQAKSVLLEAPTGFGKTGIVLEHALKQMQAGLYERCIYLTSKSTGQLQTVQQLRAMIGDGLSYLQMRNRSEHHIDSIKHSCTGDTQCDEELGQRWLESELRISDLLENGTLEIERAKALGEQTGICPYALSKACLPFADLWIGDSNYVFSPASRSVFSDPYGFDPARSLLIIDEAHNLPERVADALSLRLHATELIFAIEAISAAGASRKFISTLNELVRVIETLKPQQALDTNQCYELLDLAEDVASQLQEARLDYDALSPGIIDTIWQIPDLAKRLNEPSHQWLHWSPGSGEYRATCLDASEWIGQCLKPFGSSILMSATLGPIKQFRESCGLEPEHTVFTAGVADWREGAYQVAIDARVDTRLRQRDRHYATTAETIAMISSQSPGEPIAVFFASYQYAENIKAYLSAVDPSVRAVVQPRGVDLAEQRSFIDESLLSSDALFLILGSSYAEGIDALGGKVHTAMIVGPALPEVNLIQEAKMDAHPSLSRSDAFRDVYIQPAMQRIEQALGRLVRAPGQTARILLHGQRFTEAAYRDALHQDYQTEYVIRDTNDLVEWLAQT